jgi:hypothetical protein
MMARLSVIGAVTAATMMWICPWSSPAASTALSAVVLDGSTREPVAHAIVSIDGVETRTDERGMFPVPDRGTPVVRVRAYGYRRAEVAIDTLRRPTAQIRLTHVRPKALYLSVFGIGNRELRESALELLDSTELNALVIDVKGDRGLVGYRSAIPLAQQAKAHE